jgi:hypothetical protein
MAGRVINLVTTILCFVPDGTIPAAFYIMPGCSHNSTVMSRGGLYNKLDCVYNETGFKFIIDSDFCTANIEFLIKSS